MNPLFVDADGVLAADAWLRLRAAGDTAAVWRSRPIPPNWSSTGRAGGERLIVRPIRPEDAEQHGAFFRRLSPQDIRYRFFTAMRELSAEQMARLTQIDYDREMAFIAMREATGETVGVARLVCEPGERDGEFAVIVQADMKGRGVAAASDAAADRLGARAAACATSSARCWRTTRRCWRSCGISASAAAYAGGAGRDGGEDGCRWSVMSVWSCSL